ncbi:hypothetical protein AbraIFM66950_001691 [Aspergillus brasiliensis]|nr:hypothetical protein AbraIFM66950_001691 [Aspergillus brasiliensis]
MGPPNPPLHHEDFTVAWICALPVEMAAAEALLDERLPDLPAKPYDNNTYTFGVFHGHRVVIACLPAGVYGTNSAASVATEVRISFPSLRFGLMVGVGGGVRDAGVQLGDVVVSKPSREYGGVIQYDYGKAIDGGEWEHTGMLNKPPTVLLTAISRLQAAHLQKPSGVSELVSKVLAAKPGMAATFGYPQSSEDAPNRETTSLDQACGIHYGLIASGNKVIKDGKLRDKIAKKYDILCFEMEAAGLMDNFPCLVIRGICDYADAHKKKDWQGYASLTAAAYAKELLAVIPRHSVMETPFAALSLGWQVGNDPSRSEPLSSNWISKTRTSFDDDFLERITCYDHERVHQRISRKRLIGTTQWFLDHPEFQSWISGTTYPWLWCSGKIGSGKSIVASTAIEEARSNSLQSHAPIIFFYCDEQYASDPSQLLSSFIRQLTEFFIKGTQQFSENGQRMLQKYFGSEREVPDIDDLEDLFASLYSDVTNATYIIDGLDALEQTDARRLLTYFRSLFRTSGSRADIQVYIRESIADRMVLQQLTEDNLLIRDMENILLQESSGMFLWVYLQIEIIWYTCVTEQDIRSALATLPKGLEETYQRCVKRINCHDPRAMRALVWVRFSARPLHCEELREAVALDFNDKVWDPEKIPRCDFILGWCANLIALDPVDSCARFAHPSICQYLDSSLDAYLLQFPESVRSGNQICGRLCITYLSFSDFHLHLAKTRKEVVKWNMRSRDLLPKNVPGFRLIGYLLPSRLKRRLPFSLPSPPLRTVPPPPLAHYRFLTYARSHWTTHTKYFSVQDPLWDMFEQLALTSNESWGLHPWKANGRSQLSHLQAMFGWAVREHHMPLFELTMQFSDHIRRICNLPLTGELLPALHYACKQGYTDMVSRLLDFCDINTLDLQDFTPLHYAVERGHAGTVSILLRQKRLNANRNPRVKGELLLLASSRGHTETVNLLIKQGADLEARNTKSQTSLIVAAASGHTSTVKLLVEEGADVEAVDHEGDTARLYALENRHMEVVSYFLDIDLAKDRCKIESVLLSAIEDDDPKLVRVLIDKGLNPNSRCKTGIGRDDCTILTWAAGKGYTDLVDYLICHDVDVNLKDNAGWTPLARATKFGHDSVVSQLIKHGADIKIDYDEARPVQHAVFNRRRRIVTPRRRQAWSERRMNEIGPRWRDLF